MAGRQGLCLAPRQGAGVMLARMTRTLIKGGTIVTAVDTYAADLAIDVDEDGRITYLDVLAVSRAVEMVERDYPALVGGLGLYGNLGTAAYVHIDVRGTRKRWRG